MKPEKSRTGYAPAAYVAAVEGFAGIRQAAGPLKAISIEFYAGKR